MIGEALFGLATAAVRSEPRDMSLTSLSTMATLERSGPRRITDLATTVGDRYLLFNGVDDLALESVLLGAVGWVAGLVNAFPEETRLLWDLATSGRYEEALRVYRWFTPLLPTSRPVPCARPSGGVGPGRRSGYRACHGVCPR